MSAQRTLIVGAGLAGVQAGHWLRAGGYTGDIVLVGDENDLPYHRPPLSKRSLAPSEPLDVLRSVDYYSDRSIELRRGVRVKALDADARTASCSDATTVQWDHLVLATGAAPRQLATIPCEMEGVHALRTASDARSLWARPLAGVSVAVVGAGFVGLEFAAAARQLGAAVTVVEVAHRVLARVVSPVVSEAVDRYHRELGVRLILDDEVVGVEAVAGRVAAIRLAGGSTVPAEIVLVAVGAVPRVELAAAAGLRVDDGVAVDSRLRTSAPNVFAIGDCARWTDDHGMRRRLESVQNAGDQAAHVAAVILGSDRPFAATPWFWSDQGQLRLQIAGVPHGGDDVVQLGASTPTELTVLHHLGGTVTCVETLGRPGDHLAGRRLVGNAIDVEAVRLGRASLRDMAKLVTARR